MGPPTDVGLLTSEPPQQFPSESKAGGMRRTSSLADDGEESADGSDSDFGLSDRQLQDLWLHFREGNEDVVGIEDQILESWRYGTEVCCIGNDDDTPADRLDSDFGLSDWQLYSVRLRASSKPTQSLPSVLVEEPNQLSKPIQDPLRAFARAKGAEACTPQKEPIFKSGSSIETTPASEASTATPATSSRLSAADSLLEEQLPKRDPIFQERLSSGPGRLQATILSSRKLDRVTWYLVRLQDNNDTRFFMRRYSDFRVLDRELRGNPRWQKLLPPLPTRGRFGLRHLLDFGDFNEKRKQGLQRYLDDVVREATSFSAEPALVRCFGRAAPGRILRPPNDGPPSISQGRIPMVLFPGTSPGK
mmetsp:Transcript_21099/g.45733  ORF Transcript_21099/g.45733 Transcript_21099/m.45733 type:complete len:361 (+) Transcript_21099:146-1228(+)|eukprot:CAMPEP_0206572220 /NCGR_PEP_ID=MMETSP0325_2-20121206/28112_1 /ASSEMBLY_ACC=CAM_ASM_000347 /TAXON_ID=2866 /ORGANISM="Crypthecodinium cohnii, Strain Seligo" /LENGTH=360 /DNA_ID=CAMNT_0054076375 /DNA_START=139 /DNA_END=1221 /DNA_ORIENTATION=+